MSPIDYDSKGHFCYGFFNSNSLQKLYKSTIFDI